MRLRMTTAALALLALSLLALAPRPVWSAKILEPMDVTWERIFKIDWEVGERRGQPVVRGYLRNDSPYIVNRVQLLVDALDGSGAIMAQRVNWVAGSTLEPFSRTYFEVPAPPRSASYRVRVFAFDRIEGGLREP